MVFEDADLEASLDDKGIATIYFNHGLFAIVDRDLFATLSGKIWHLNKQPEHIPTRSSFGQAKNGKQRFRTLQNAVVQLDLLPPHERKEHVTQVNEKSLVFT